MDWIHCNRCFIQPGEEKEKMFWLTNCGHMFCDDCLARGPNNTFGCHVCKKSCNTQHLKPENLQGEIKEYFMNFDVFIEKALKVRSFQNDHRLKLAQHNSNLEKKTRVLRRQCKDIYTEIHGIQEKITALEFENSNLKRMNKSLTPTNFQFSRDTPQSESNYFRGNSNLFTPPSTPRQQMSHPHSVRSSLQQTPSLQKLAHSRSTQGRVATRVLSNQSEHPGYSASRLPPSISSSKHSLNVGSAKRSPNLSIYMSPSPMGKGSQHFMLGSTPEYVSQLQQLSLTPGRNSVPNSGE